MFDQGGKLWLLEVQNRPNLLAWSGLDRRIKSGLVDEVKEVRMGRGAVGGGGTAGAAGWTCSMAAPGRACIFVSNLALPRPSRQDSGRPLLTIGRLRC